MFQYTGTGSFNTARADVCVYRGKWQYDVLLETRGVMQFGWCTLKCYFSHETGVGDTWTSFSYDGGRVRKWNVLNSKYGDVRTKKNPIGFVFLSKSLFFYLVLVIWRCYILSNRL